MPELMERFRAVGRRAADQEVHLQDLEALARECALVIVSAGQRRHREYL